MQNALNGNLAPLTVIADLCEAAWSNESCRCQIRIAISFAAFTTGWGVFSSCGIVNRLLLSASIITGSVLGSQTGQHTRLWSRHHWNMPSANRWIVGFLEPLIIAFTDCQLSHANTMRCLVTRAVDCKHHRMPTSSRNVLLSLASSLVNSARNKLGSSQRRPLANLRTPPPAATADAS